jgi:hypothetical protein
MHVGGEPRAGQHFRPDLALGCIGLGLFEDALQVGQHARESPHREGVHRDRHI